MWELDHKESWIPKNWCFQTVVLEKTPESPWMARKQNQSILKEINNEYSLEELMLKLKLQYFGHLMRRTDSLEKTLMLGKIKAGGEGIDRGWDGWMASPIQWTWIWASSRSWWWTGKPGMLQSMGSQRVGHDWATELNWTELIDGSPPGSPVPGILPARILEWVAISFSNACMHAKLLLSCLTLCYPLDSSLPGSSVYRILQARILEWVASSFSQALL